MDFEISDLDFPIKKCGNTIMLTFSMQYKLLKFRDSYDMKKISSDLWYRQKSLGYYMIFRRGLECISMSANEFNDLSKFATRLRHDYCDEPCNSTENRLKVQLFFLTYNGREYKRLLVQETLSLIEGDKYNRAVFYAAYYRIEHRKFYRKCFYYRDCEIYEFLHCSEYFNRFRDIVFMEIKTAVDDHVSQSGLSIV